MKKSLVSIFLAGVLFFSNIGMTTFAVEREQDASGSALSSQEDGEKEKEKAIDISDEEEISYYKITDFTSLPENISQQKVRIGASLEDIVFPDTLEVKVEPDLDREDRIMRKLAQERDRIRREKELEEAEAASSASSDEADEAASEGSSFDEDEEEIIIFDDGEYSDDASELSQEETEKEETIEETITDTPATDSTIAPIESGSGTDESTEPIQNEENTDEEWGEEGSGDESIGGDGDGSDNSADQENSEDASDAVNSLGEGLVGRIIDVFKSVKVYAAEDSKEEKEEVSEPSIERISGIEWVLEAEYNDGVDFFSPDQDGQIFLFTPVLLIPDNYYIEDELPIITVIVSEDYFPFDEKVEVDDVTIRVRADKGVFPEGATVSAQRLSLQDEEKVQEAFDEQVEVDPESIVKEYTFDITVLDRDGNEVQPDTDKGRVFVSFETEEVADESLSAEVYHFVEENSEFNDDVDTEYLDERQEKEREVLVEDIDESSLGEERAIDMLYDDNAVLKVEKLETEVVDIEEGKALEVETSGFSVYTVMFKSTFGNSNEVTISGKSIIKLSDAMDDLVRSTGANVESSLVSGAVFLDGTSTADDYIELAKIKYESGLPKTDSNYKYEKVEDGLWSLIVKRPFEGEKEINVTYAYNDGTEHSATQYKVIIKNGPVTTVNSRNNNYPEAISLKNNEFTLKMSFEEEDTSGITYQWRFNDGTKWYDIPFANTSKFNALIGSSVIDVPGEGSFTVDSGFKFLCCVNGIDSNDIQVLVPAIDTERTWDNYCGGANQCYISNGAVAYTVLDEGSNKVIFDVRGEYIDENGIKKMIQTTKDAAGWRIFSDKLNEASNKGYEEYSYNLEYMSFSFNPLDAGIIHVKAKPKTDEGYKCFAIGTNVQLGNSEKSTVTSETLNGSIKQLSIVGLDSWSKAQTSVAKGEGDEIASMLITNITSTGNTYYHGKNTNYKPYPSTSTGETRIENAPIGIRLAWTNIIDAVAFDISLKSVVGNEIIKPTKIGKADNTYSISNIKKVEMVGSNLDSYAKSIEKPSDNVVVTLRFASAKDTGKKAINEKLPSYKKVTTTSLTETKYLSDYFEVDVTKKVNEESNIAITELPVDITLSITYDFKDKENIKVFRYHKNLDGSESAVDLKDSGDGSYSIDNENGKITIHTKKFSTFGVAYEPITYYTVSFYIDKNTINKVQVKSGNQLAVPENPVKDGYTFLAWSTSSDSKKYKDYIYDFSKPVTSNFTLYAVFQENNASSEEEGDVNGSRAPGTNDSLPIVWLWVLVLIAGVGSFGYAFYERFKEKGGDNGSSSRFRGLKRTILLIGIVASTVVKFIVKKIKQHKYECMLAASTVLILISVGTLVSTMVEYHKSEEIYIDVNDEYVDEQGADVQEMADREDLAESAQNEGKNWWDDVNVDVAGLSEEYPDVVGWIYFENEEISYPIMYSGDNSKYLSTAYTGKKARAGAIFIDGESTPDFSDPHSLIYGHNMRDLSMFGRLKYYKTDNSYYDEHQYFQVFTKDGVYRYQIFAYEEVPDSHDVFWVYGQEPEGMEDMLKEIEKDSYRKTGVNPTENDHIITLATCTSKEDKRLIVSAVRTDEHNF